MTLMNSFNIGLKGLLVESSKMDIYTENIANVDTPGYKRKIAVVTPSEDISFESIMKKAKDNVFQSGVSPAVGGGVDLPGVIEDPTPGEKIFMPGHPDADENGYVTMSNVTILNEMADATMTSKSYEAILSLMTITKQMSAKALEIGKG